MDVKEAVKDVLQKIKKGDVFDANAIIAYVLQKSPAVSFSLSVNKINKFDEEKLIEDFEKNGMIERLECKSWSKNINDDFATCPIWKKKS
ncbi:MAG: hypothetical protein LBV16_00975 [Elusimicrobiota bacterium]|jgi:uncharacterized protein (UPF0297 family)|nr:hypothetical protein [Elusimicrobiota bacterium]